MVWVIFAMVLVLALAAAVVGVVAVPARRQGRQILTPKGEEVVASVARSTDKVRAGTKGTVESARRVARPKPSTGRHSVGAPTAPAAEGSREAS